MAVVAVVLAMAVDAAQPVPIVTASPQSGKQELALAAAPERQLAPSNVASVPARGTSSNSSSTGSAPSTVGDSGSAAAPAKGEAPRSSAVAAPAGSPAGAGKAVAPTPESSQTTRPEAAAVDQPAKVAPTGSVQAGAAARVDGTSRGGTLTAETTSSGTPVPTATSAPVQQVAELSQPAPRTEIITYTVKSGDSISGIADKYGISARTVVKANGLRDPESITIGAQLTILPVSGFLYTVKAGDTVVDLADRFRVIPEDIIAVNHLVDPYIIRPDEQILIPESPGNLNSDDGLPAGTDGPLVPKTYTVVLGDTLARIAGKFGISVDTLMWANNLDDPNLLTVDMELIVPPVDGVLYTVKEGDTVSRIAARYSASAVDIIRANALEDPYVVTVGQKLVIPGGVPPAPTPTATPTPRPQPTSTPRPTGTPTHIAQQATPTPTKAGDNTGATATPVPTKPPEPAPAGIGDKVVTYAKQFLGYRYVWGGTSPKPGFDCSGFVWYVYRQVGLPVPRDLWGQLNSGTRIARANLQPGDLVFFENTYTVGLSHVGIYIGNGEFIQAASENTGVIITKLDDKYWAARYVGATRPSP